VCFKGDTFLVLSCPSDVPFVSQALKKLSLKMERNCQAYQVLLSAHEKFSFEG
jgi:hypothetical protein